MPTVEQKLNGEKLCKEVASLLQSGYSLTRSDLKELISLNKMHPATIADLCAQLEGWHFEERTGVKVSFKDYSDRSLESVRRKTRRYYCPTLDLTDIDLPA